MSLTVQFQTMIAMVATGGLIGALLDTYGRFLKRPKREKWFVFLTDCFFWLLQGLIIFYILLHVNQGELRFYIFLALLCGFAAYQSLLHSIYVSFLDKVIFTTIKINSFLYRLFIGLVVKPIKIGIQALLTLLLLMGNGLFVTMSTILKILLAPFKWVVMLTWKILPKNGKNFLRKIAGFSFKIKNILVKWWKRFRS